MSEEENVLRPNEIADDIYVTTRRPRRIPEAEDNLEFHAARLLLLLRYAGGKHAKIVGRTRLAKLDFFVRYPTYLAKALNQIEYNMLPSPESPMIRYKYGPWDNKYFNVFALLLAKGLVTIEASKHGDVFTLTDRGAYAAEELNTPEYEEIIDRCKAVYKRFKDMSGTQLKSFIYQNFPEIVAETIGEEIR